MNQHMKTLAAAACGLLTLAAARAETFTWTGTGGGGWFAHPDLLADFSCVMRQYETFLYGLLHTEY